MKCTFGKIVSACLLACAATGCVQATKEKAMIDSESFYVGKIVDCDQVVNRHPRFAKAFEFLKRPDLFTLPVGRYELDGDNMWAMIQDAELKPFGDIQHPEVHATYIDIQAPLTGPETIGLLPLTPEALAKIAVDAGKDIGFFDAKTQPATLTPGEFAILMPPYGGHAPCRSMDGARKIRKLVIKIRK